jgi:hypothetical protein
VAMEQILLHFHSLCWSPFCHYIILIYHCLLKHVTALIRQNIVTSSAQKYWELTKVYTVSKEIVAFLLSGYTPQRKEVFKKLLAIVV